MLLDRQRALREEWGMAAPTRCSQRPELDGPCCSLPALPTPLADHDCSLPCSALPPAPCCFSSPASQS